MEGTDQIIKRLKQLEKRLTLLEARLGKPKQIAKAPVLRRGITDQIMALREDGFFDKPRRITEVKIKLAERGYHCPITTLSPLLLGLVRSKQLVRQLTAEGFRYRTS